MQRYPVRKTIKVGKAKKQLSSQNQKRKRKKKTIPEEQYPPTDDKYKHLEERLSVMEIQKVPGLDFEELGLVSGIVIPPKFKAPVFAKYDGVSCPKMHLRSYVRKIQPHTSDKRFMGTLLPRQSVWNST